MSFVNTDEVIDALEFALGGSSDNVTEDEKDHAVTAALRELNWTLPETDGVKSYWILERAKRHCLFILMIEAAHKFRFKDIHQNQRYKNYKELITDLDEVFEKAKDDNPAIFVGVGVLATTGEAFMQLVGPGFIYDAKGVDLTYQD